MRTLGKFVECIPPARLSAALRQQCAKCLFDGLLDDNASVRSKAMRSLGKWANGHLTARAGAAETICHHSGRRRMERDRAFVVRKSRKRQFCSYRTAIGFLSSLILPALTAKVGALA
jgi:hypothetical protein